MPRVLKQCCSMTVCARIACKGKDACEHSHQCKKKKYVDEGADYVCNLHAKNECKPECSICWGEINAKDAMKTNVCSHVFHKSCLKPWIEKNPSCPNCRARIPVPRATPSRPRELSTREVNILAAALLSTIPLMSLN